MHVVTPTLFVGGGCKNVRAMKERLQALKKSSKEESGARNGCTEEVDSRKSQRLQTFSLEVERWGKCQS